jgi:hypothetical protein
MQEPKIRWWNPWPRDMVITVEDHPQRLHMLLFIRNSWRIAADVGIPDLSPAPDPGNSALPSTPGREEWDGRWRALWDLTWEWFGNQDVNPSGPPFRTAPFWIAQYGLEAMDHPAYDRWSLSLMPKFPNSAERDNLSELIPAWENGLQTVVVVPYAGFFAQRISAGTLIVSAETRNNPQDYGQALRLRM